MCEAARVTTKRKEESMQGAESAASELLWSPDDLRASARELGDLIARYESELRGRPVFPPIDRAAMREIAEKPFPEHG
jgi:hypothetical protein